VQGIGANGVLGHIFNTKTLMARFTVDQVLIFDEPETDKADGQYRGFRREKDG